MSNIDTAQSRKSSNNETVDNRQKLKIPQELGALIAQKATQRGVSRSDYLATSVRFFEDRAGCDYLVEHAFLLREQSALALGVDQLMLSNRVLSESLVSIEGAALKALIQTAVVARQLTNEGRTKAGN